MLSEKLFKKITSKIYFTVGNKNLVVRKCQNYLNVKSGKMLWVHRLSL
jgi:hypothetical protein